MADRMKATLDCLAKGENLSQEAMQETIGTLMRGEADEAQIAQLLTSLAEKGETVEEVAGAALAMREHMTPLRSKRTGLVDTCGTGGGWVANFQHQYHCRHRCRRRWGTGRQARQPERHQPYRLSRCAGRAGREYRSVG